MSFGRSKTFLYSANNMLNKRETPTIFHTKLSLPVMRSAAQRGTTSVSVSAGVTKMSQRCHGGGQVRKSLLQNVVYLSRRRCFVSLIQVLNTVLTSERLNFTQQYKRWITAFENVWLCSKTSKVQLCAQGKGINYDSQDALWQETSNQRV